MSAIELSIVIPTYNEAKRLPTTLRAIDGLRNNGFGTIEVIVADDGSDDGTPEIAEALGARALRLGRVGAGSAVRSGVLDARGERILLCDADGAVPFDDLHALAQALDEGWSIAAGSRVLRPQTVLIPQPRHRIFMGRVWAGLVQRLLPTPVRDTQCGFKLFTREAAHATFSQARSRGFAFHVEVLSLAHSMQLRVIELPVRWRDQPGSKIRLLWDSAHMLGELLGAARRIRARAEVAG